MLPPLSACLSVLGRLGRFSARLAASLVLPVGPLDWADVRLVLVALDTEIQSRLISNTVVKNIIKAESTCM